MILKGYHWQTFLIYIDDAIVLSLNAEQYVRDVDEILQVLGDTGVSLKFDKCIFFTDTIRYLGHIIKPARLKVDENDVKDLTRA